MQQIWSDEELRARWIVSDAELGLLKGMSERRRLTLCYYLKYFQLHAQFPTSLDFVSAQVLEFLASQIGSAEDHGLPVVPKRTERWSRKFGPVVKVDRLTRKTIRNDQEKDAYA